MDQVSPAGASQLLSTSLSAVVQLGLPTQVAPEEVARKRTLGGAIELCAEAAGFDLDKQLSAALRVDKGQFSRWTSGTEGVVWPKLKALMGHCGNEVPVLWMAHDVGFDIASMRKRESKLEQQLRHAREENAALRRVLLGGK